MIVSIYANWQFVAFLKARSSSRTSAVRQFKVSKLRFDAHEVHDLIDWQNSHTTEPPLTTDISEDQLNLFLTSGEPPMADFPKLPRHTQAVERCVKLVAESSSRDCFIRSQLECRLINPTVN